MLIEAAAGQLEDGEDLHARSAASPKRNSASRSVSSSISFGPLRARAQPPSASTSSPPPYTSASQTGDGGGLAEEGDDIEVLELRFDEALAMTINGGIIDAKTIILLQWAALSGPFAK